MDRVRRLAVVSALQLGAGVAGVAVAVRRGHPYDLPMMRLRGRDDRIARDAIVSGTALSAPMTMLGAQAAATAMAARGEAYPAAPVLTLLGALMVPGYLGERLVQRRMRPGGWDSVESPLIAAGLGLAAAMMLLGPTAAR